MTRKPTDALLAVDVGNSDVTVGLWRAGQWQHVWRTRSDVRKPPHAYAERLASFFREAGVARADVASVVLSSVVPPLTDRLRTVLAEWLGLPPLVVGTALYPHLPISLHNPHEIGTDLVCNALAAHLRYGQNCVIVDFGTALTFTTVRQSGQVVGVAIAPGLKTAIRALFQHTARLPEVPLRMPTTALGTTTVGAIQAGILFGYEGLVNNMVARIRAELGGDCLAIATGGLAAVITPLRDTFHAIDPHLTLDGLRLMGELVPALPVPDQPALP